ATTSELANSANTDSCSLRNISYSYQLRCRVVPPSSPKIPPERRVTFWASEYSWSFRFQQRPVRCWGDSTRTCIFVRWRFSYLCSHIPSCFRWNLTSVVVQLGKTKPLDCKFLCHIRYRCLDLELERAALSMVFTWPKCRCPLCHFD